MTTERINPSSTPMKPGPVAPPQKMGASPTPVSIVRLLPRRNRSLNWKSLSAVILGSIFLHAIALGACAFIVLKNPQLLDEIFTTIIDPEENNEPIVEQSLLQPEDLSETSQEHLATQETTSKLNFETLGPIDLNVSEGIPQIEADSSNLPGLAEMAIANETVGRMSAQAKKAMVAKFGGNSASEAAVASGMKWLTNHQLPDGSWSFAHSKHADCKGQCSQDGSFAACPTGATGMALLAFLGGGHTHQKGDYQRNVKRAVDFLIKAGKPSATGLDLRGKVAANEAMYVQGICTIALCECAAMTKDSRIKKAAEGALDFIVKAQNPNDGGWRYAPGQPGDLSVSGWEIMALKSGYNAKLKFPAQAFKNAEKFLNLVQDEGGAQYKYVPGPNEPGADKPPPSPTMTAVGLLCRMYLGWDHKNKKLAQGVGYLDKVKPQSNNMYFNYYATQVMHHWGGEEWTRWNEVMRDHLIRTQHPLKDGHLAGSWDIADPHGGGGGRLYMTCLSIMTLEVYYRHLPMYSREKIKVEF